MANVVDIRDFQDDYLIKSVGSGVTANCFLTKDNTIFKEFKKGLAESLEDKCNYLSTFENDNFTFPKQLVYLDKKFIGYIRDYAPGKSIDDLEDSINFKRMIVALKELEQSTNELYEKLSFVDLSGDNIVYDQLSNKMTIIDTDLFEEATDGIYHRGKNEIMTYYDNRKWISQSFYTLTKECNIIPQKLSIKFSRLADINIYGYSTASEYLLGLICELELLTKCEIQTIGDYKKSINILVKER